MLTIPSHVTKKFSFWYKPGLHQDSQDQRIRLNDWSQERVARDIIVGELFVLHAD
jgi:hypothetical protein